jgi:hypothetical protein
MTSKWSPGERAGVYAETCANGMVTVVRLAHFRTATVMDRLQPELCSGRGYKNLLVYCPNQMNFFDTGQLVYAWDEHFPGGWYGGALPGKRLTFPIYAFGLGSCGFLGHPL